MVYYPASLFWPKVTGIVPDILAVAPSLALLSRYEVESVPYSLVNLSSLKVQTLGHVLDNKQLILWLEGVKELQHQAISAGSLYSQV